MSTLPKHFSWNQIPYEIIDRFENWILVAGTRVFPTGKPVKFYDCGNIRIDNDGDEQPPSTLGLQDEPHMRDLEYTRKRFEAGKDKILTDRLRKENNLQAERDILQAEQKRIDFLSAIESKKRHCLEELHLLYEKSEKPEGLTSNKRVLEILHQVAAYDSFKFYYRHTIYKL
jgi:hypothetical protein